MNHELYIAASGMMARGRAVEIISKKMAFNDVPGSKEENIYYREFNNATEAMSREDKWVNTGVQYAGYYVDFSQGNINHTGTPTDFCINGDGFFELTDEANTFYTRAGQFKVNYDGKLVDNRGLYLLGESGNPIDVGKDEFSVNESGEVYIGKQLVDTISVVDFPNKSLLTKTGESLFQNTAPGVNLAESVENRQLVQGAVEQSNFNLMKGISELITSVRLFETYSKNVQMINELNGKSINEIGTV